MYIFDHQSEFFRYPQGGIRAGSKISVKIYVKKCASNKPKITISKRNDYDANIYNEVYLNNAGTKDSYNLYEGIFVINEPGHYYYNFFINEHNASPNYELLVFNKDYDTPDWIKGGLIYHIFVDRFYREEIFNKNDKRGIVIRNDWGGMPNYIPDKYGEVANNDFFGGNLDGIIKKLPYLKELGVTAIYLSPIFEAYSNHKYDTGDYLKIDPMFGDEKLLSMLCGESKKYGIGIILDGVFSHTGDDSIYFNKYGSYNSAGAFQSKQSPYFEWYTFNNWNDDYKCWWGIKTLPEINEENKSYINFIAGENGVIEHWQNIGVKGWRLDVADELSNAFLNTLRDSVKSDNPDAYIVGEVWEDASNKFSYGILKEYFCGNQLDSVTNYPLRESIVSYVKHKDCEMLYETMNFIIEKYPPQTVNVLMNIIGTHDTKRILTELGSESNPVNKDERAVYKLSDKELYKGTKLLKIASLLQFTLPGVPCIYYGDESGMEGFEDPFNRACYPWGNENMEILNHYKFLSHLRKNNIFKEGKYKCIVHDKEVFIFERYDDTNRCIIAVNLSNETITLKLKNNMRNYKTGNFDNLYNIKPNKYLILIPE